MITIGFPPPTAGGTEAYVEGLISSLRKMGHECEVLYLQAVPAKDGAEIDVEQREYEGTRIHVIRVNQELLGSGRLSQNPYTRDLIVKRFVSVAEFSKPDLVHFHPLHLGIHAFVMEQLRQRGLPVLMTYHIPTLTCMRGDLLRFGKVPCNGKIDIQRCAACVWHAKGIPKVLAQPFAFIARQMRFFERFSGTSKFATFISIPSQVAEIWQAWTKAAESCDWMVAVSSWVQDLMKINGVDQERLAFSRQGLRLNVMVPSVKIREETLRLGYLGRISPLKGIATLLEVLEGIPVGLKVEFEFIVAGSWEALSKESPDLTRRLEGLCQRDPRISLKTGLPKESLGAALASWDAMVVPSLWLETGPMVIYEAFSVQTPVIGSRRGGIAELIEEGKNGFLFEAGSVPQLRELLLRFIQNPSELRELRSGIPPPRTFDEVANEMIGLYEGMLRERKKMGARR